MTAEFQYMMHLAGCAALGETPQPPPCEIDWEQVLTFANEQTVLTLVQYAMKKAPFAIPEEYRSKAVNSLNCLTVQGVVRRMGVLSVLAELEKQGISAAVIKGFAIARDYAQPDVRISGDADIFVREEDEERALAVFEQFGFSYTPREKTHKDTTLTHPKYGVVELHIRLFEEFVDQIWHNEAKFEIREPYQKVETADGTYYALGDTDHFLYVLEHMMKHFVADGLSLRMVMDMGALLMWRGDTFNQERVKMFLEQRHYKTAIKIFLHILSEYCGFPFEKLQSEYINECQKAKNAVLEDMENGGTRGFKTGDGNSRKDGLRIYNAQMQKKQSGLLRRFYAKNQELIRLVFPALNVMQEKYPWLEKAVFLYPIAWVHRMLTRGGYHVRKKDLDIKNWQFAVEESKLQPNNGTQRAEMFRLLDMM